MDIYKYTILIMRLSNKKIMISWKKLIFFIEVCSDFYVKDLISYLLSSRYAKYQGKKPIDHIQGKQNKISFFYTSYSFYASTFKFNNFCDELQKSK